MVRGTSFGGKVKVTPEVRRQHNGPWTNRATLRASHDG